MEGKGRGGVSRDVEARSVALRMDTCAAAGGWRWGEAEGASRGIKGASRGHQGGIKGASRGHQGGIKGVSRGYQGGITGVSRGAEARARVSAPCGM